MTKPINTPLDRALAFQQSALNLRAYRQEVLASNIANADTPNFKARDFDFQSALQNAVDQRQGNALPLARTDAAHLPGQPAAAGANGSGTELLYRNEHQASLDGNTVDVDVERAAFAENSVKYDASLTFINQFLKSMQNALSS